MRKKNIAILGSTGSIGTQAIEVIREQKDFFAISVITANNNSELLIQQALEFKPDLVVIGNENKYHEVKEALKHTIIEVKAGADAIAEAAAYPATDMALTAMVGYSGLLPTIHALKAGKDIALANKETLVVAGELITNLAQDNNCKIIPVDSEHSAIFQCLVGEEENEIEKIYLTASGGPFRGKDADCLRTVTKFEALKHPNWDMGAKITIDSASLMNKGFEAIEAKWLFNLQTSEIDVIVHPQSIIHSLVQFRDGSMKAQMGLPDMKLPIQYALSYPKRIKAGFNRFDFMKYPTLTFEAADRKNFRNLEIAFHALEHGGNIPCIVNAANEIVVAAFLKEEIGFLEMSDVIEQTMSKVEYIKNPTFDDYVKTDAESRQVASGFTKTLSK